MLKMLINYKGAKDSLFISFCVQQQFHQENLGLLQCECQKNKDLIIQYKTLKSFLIVRKNVKSMALKIFTQLKLPF